MIRWLNEISRSDLTLVGGKAANLGELITLGLPVPRGFVITADNFASHISASGMLNSLSERLAAEDWIGAESLAVSVIGDCSLNEELETVIASAYAEMGTPPVAVRSSATAEDTADDSFAGQYETCLEVHGLNDLIDAVRRCWASTFSRRVLHYQHQRSIDHVTTQMAVIVQQMVPADLSGVIFTVDPTAPETNQILVETTLGLGEALVSGTRTGDTYLIDRNSFRVAQYQGPHRQLDSATIRTLCSMALKAESRLGCPQDLEFAIEGQAVHLLQTRPVTTLAEASAEPLPPLGKPSLLDKAVKPIADERYVVSPKPLDNITFTRLVGALIYAVRKGGGAISEEDEQVFRSRIYRQAYRLPPLKLTPKAFFPLPARIGILKKDWQSWWDSGPRRVFASIAAPVDLSNLSDQELLERADRILSAWEQPLKERFWAATGAWMEPWLKKIVTLAVGRAQSGAVLADLMSGLNSPTGEVNDALWQLSRMARQDASIYAAVRELKPDRLKTTIEGRDFLMQFDAFIDEYGHREGASYHLSTPTWRHDPMQVWRLLGSLVEVKTRSGDSHRDERRYHAAAGLVQRRLRWYPGMRGLFRWLTDRLRAIQTFRESSHFDLTRPLDALQDIAAEWGKRLTERGVINRSDDVFYLTHDEVRRWLTNSMPEPGDVAALVKQRRATYKVAEARWQAGRMDGAACRDKLKGVAAGPGVARGPVRIIESENDFEQLRPGEVLVCPYSNPAWTPLFCSAAAVITETGGISSHAATVAREYGIPAVMALKGAISSLRNGDEVMVDGDRGLVHKIQPRVNKESGHELSGHKEGR